MRRRGASGSAQHVSGCRTDALRHHHVDPDLVGGEHQGDHPDLPGERRYRSAVEASKPWSGWAWVCLPVIVASVSFRSMHGANAVPGSVCPAQSRSMDSLSQIALGAAVGVATMGRRTAPWKAALWGAVAGTLPDLDVLIDHGDPVRNMVLHRAESHALFWLSLASLPLGAAAARVHGEWSQWRRWWLALWLALVTHPLLDAMTVYGTRLALPFSDEPFGLGSIFIIDPLYTLPLLLGTGWALATADSSRGRAFNLAGLALSTAYLGWSLLAQHHVAQLARASLAVQGIAAERVLVTPAPFNTLLWRVVAVDGDSFHEAYRSLLDEGAALAFDRFPRGKALSAGLEDADALRRMAAFSKGYYKLSQDGEQVLLTDLRMGQEPAYVFSFVIGERRGQTSVPRALPQQRSARPDIARWLPWLWRRALGEPLPPPR
jgi:inner membrane protein